MKAARKGRLLAERPAFQYNDAWPRRVFLVRWEGRTTWRHAAAEPGLNGKQTTARRSDRFLHGLKDVINVTFVSHVHPDPDSIGSMMGLAHLIEVCLGIPTRLTRDGLISRAENRAMVDLLDLDLVPIEDAAAVEGEVFIMVDSQPNTGRHNLSEDAPLRRH